MKTVFMLLVFTTLVMGKNTALFSSVKGVAKNDTLNVRAEANYNAKKVAALPSDAYIGIETCKTIKSSTWCRVYPLVQQWYENFGDENDTGWVNARYLAFHNKGYVLIDGKGNCAYAISCKDNICEVVTDFEVKNEHEITKVKTKHIERSRLKGESRFGAMDPKEDGYCNTAMYLDEYLKKDKNSGEY